MVKYYLSVYDNTCRRQRTYYNIYNNIILFGFFLYFIYFIIRRYYIIKKFNELSTKYQINQIRLYTGIVISLLLSFLPLIYFCMLIFHCSNPHYIYLIPLSIIHATTLFLKIIFFRFEESIKEATEKFSEEDRIHILKFLSN